MEPTVSQNDIEQFWSIYPNLPPDVQKAIFSDETAKVVEGLTEKYGLEGQPTSKLANIVGDVLLGLLPLDNVKQKLIEVYSLPEELAQKIDDELENLLFRPLEGNLGKLHYINRSHLNTPKILKDIYGEPIE